MSIIEEKKIKRPLDDIDLQLNQKMAKSVLLNGENEIPLDYQGQRLGRQTMVIKMDKQHNIRVSDLDFVDIDEEHVNKPEDRKFDDACSICSKKIYYDKYICCLCFNCVLCTECEKEHLHPVIKCRDFKMATLADFYCYLSRNQMSNQKPKGFFSSLFEAKIEVELGSISTKFAMRPNKKIKIPIKIENKSNTHIKSNTFMTLISRNSKDLIIHDTQITNSINKKEKHEVDVLVESNIYCKLYNFTIELYAPNMNFVSSPLKFTIEVNNDEEDEELNKFFQNYPKVFVLTKEKKKSIKYIMDQRISHNHPYIIMKMLENSQWNLDLTIRDIRESKHILSK